jgi:hypothetical protein
MSHHLSIIREIFPSQLYLTPKEIARVLHGPGRDTKKRTEVIRQQLDDGTLVPGLRKRPGQKRWQVSVVELAAALDRQIAHEVGYYYNTRPAVLRGGSSGRFKNPGPRLVR